MARSTCPKCEHTGFEIVENEPTNSMYKIIFIQCSKCGAVVGTTDFYNIGERTAEIKEALKKIAQTMGVYLGPNF